MKYDPIPPELFRDNRGKLADLLPGDAFAVVLAADLPWRSADGTTRYLQDSDFFWLTGIEQEESALILCPGHPDPARREQLFVRETSDLIAVWEGHKLSQDQAAKASGIETVEWSDAFEPALRRISREFGRVFLNHNEHARAASPLGITRADRFRERFQDLHPDHRCERLAPLLHRCRAEKSEHELALIRRACDITAKGFDRMLGTLRPGVLEYELEAELLHEFTRRGSRGFAYEPIIASGENNCVLHYLDNDRPCREGELVLFDVAAEYACYNADLSRTLPVSGKFSSRQREVYEAVLRVFRRCIDDLIRPGKHIREEYQVEAARLVEEELIGLGLLERNEVEEERAQEDLPEEGRAYRRYFMHGVSHSLGLDVHDVTPAEGRFVENMVVTVEPGIYLQDEGFGIRLENDILVRESGNVDLMADIPIEPDEIEELMGGRREVGREKAQKSQNG